MNWHPPSPPREIEFIKHFDLFIGWPKSQPISTPPVGRAGVPPGMCPLGTGWQARASKDGAEDGEGGKRLALVGDARGCVLTGVASEIAHMTEPVAIILDFRLAFAGSQLATNHLAT